MTPAKTTATIHTLRPKLLKPQDGSETRLVQTSVAVVLGLNAALFLQQLNFRLRTPSHVVDGVAWYEASYASLQAVDFPFWSEKTIARTARRLEKRGIITARPMSRNTYDRTKWYTINDEKLQEALGCTTGQSVPLEGTASPHHHEDTVSPSLEEETREKKEPEGAHMCKGQEDEDQLPAQPQAATVDTTPAEAAPPCPVGAAPSRPVAEPEATDTRAVQSALTEKQQACPHPFAQVVTLTGGITICNHCFGLVAFDPLADAA
ncbi:MAG TPA: hypothetical protein VE844_12800 [Gammaproteobacteria bacterium]|nr:hypothetical protein [Gammaproteobacteria bacterium]